MALVTEEQVVKVLQQYNPWWRNRDAIKEQSKPQKRFAYWIFSQIEGKSERS
jgi:hypothetical protein